MPSSAARAAALRPAGPEPTIATRSLSPTAHTPLGATLPNQTGAYAKLRLRPNDNCRFARRLLAPFRMTGGTQQQSRARFGVLVLGLALAAVVAALVWRGQSDDAPGAAPSAPVAADGSISALEARVAQNPDDGAAWGALGFARY